MNTFLDKMGLQQQRSPIPLAQSPPLMKRLASKHFSVPVIPAGILGTSSVENSPHRPSRNRGSERIAASAGEGSPDTPEAQVGDDTTVSAPEGSQELGEPAELEEIPLS